MTPELTGPHWHSTTDVVIVGSGVAGLTTALEAAALGLRVIAISKADLASGNTRLAQGGIAAVLPGDHEPGDTVSRHIADTIVAGAGLCDPRAVSVIVADGPAAVTTLRSRGAIFDTTVDGQLARGREGGHSAFRIVHAGGDATGAEVERALALAAQEQRISLLDNHVAVDILRSSSGAIAGLLVLDSAGMAGVISAPAVVLATGGIGQLYQVTSNSDTATGDGIFLALRAGAAVSDMEFVQFHPTVLYTGRTIPGRHPLITEALRGEGAVLLDQSGTRIMPGVHPLADLAPRDVVSAAITRTMHADQTDHVLLDATHLDKRTFQQRFPTVYAACRIEGIDPASMPIPVAPAAHFSCGGVVTSIDGRTSVAGLYVVGEVARTGLHGANRLASNSILEGLVLGARSANAIAADFAMHRLTNRACPEFHAMPAMPVADRNSVQRLMSRHLAIGRSASGLAVAQTELGRSTVTRSLRTAKDVENAALTMTAGIVLAAAAYRTESRGCHVRLDYPEIDDLHWRHSTVLRLDAAGRPWIRGSTSIRKAA